MTELLWDCGTAYDMFVSLEVLYHPAEFEVRGAWAAGVRARLPATARAALEQAQLVGIKPLCWLNTLPPPKNGTAVLRTLDLLPPAERLPALEVCPDWPPPAVAALLREVSARGTWTDQDKDALNTLCCEKTGHKALPPGMVTATLDAWAHPADFGERLLDGLGAYQDVFFAEEERRIRPSLEAALAHAQERAAVLAVPELLEELSQGLRLEGTPPTEAVVLAPCYWCTPLVYYGALDKQRTLYLFGARPPEGSLIPGETVPDALVRALKALSDPTRLRILRYLAEQPQTPAELARRLRLRIPTVMHHLQTLRLAGLLRVILESGEGGKETKRYAARPEEVAAAFSTLQGMLAGGEPEMAEARENVEE